MPSIKSTGYTVHIGSKALHALNSFLAKKKYSSYVILCDENTLTCCLPILVNACPKLASAEIIEIESGEASKSLEVCALIWQTLLEQGADKQQLILNLGGGVVSDLGGFAASVYKRGIDVVNIPTSLLAMADASVGGKTGIDFLQVKNVIGNFAQPQAVFIYPPFLETLPPRHLNSGWAEILKIALISDRALWESLRAKGNNTSVDKVIVRSVQLKNNVVIKDPFDQGRRHVLNFGHSLGHAIETLYLGTERELLHGEAIVAGMLMESHIAHQKKRLHKKELQEILETFRQFFEPLPLCDANLNDVLGVLKNDKKNQGGNYLFSLPSRIGACDVKIPVTANQIQKAIDYYKALLS